MSDPVVEAAQRAMRAVHGYPKPNHDLIIAAREALKPVRELHRGIDTGDRYTSGLHCSAGCYGRWPCDTAKLIYTTEELDTHALDTERRC